MPETTYRELLISIRTRMAEDIAVDDVPQFSKTDLARAQAHIDYLNDLCEIDDRLPSFTLVTTTTYSIQVNQPG